MQNYKVQSGDTLSKIAIHFFNDSKKYKLIADEDNIREITRKTNGGYNGLADRESYLKRVKQVFGI